MESTTPSSSEAPTALPGFEDEDAREKLLLEATAELPDGESEDDDEVDPVEERGKPKNRRWRVMRTVGGFAIFLSLLAFAVSWFFRMGWFAEPQAQPVSRNASKESQTSPVTGDEKLKMALSMVGTNESKTGGTTSISQIDPDETSSIAGRPVSGDNSVEDTGVGSGIPIKTASTADEVPYALQPPASTPGQKGIASDLIVANAPIAAKKEIPASTVLRTDASGDTPGRSIFFGVTRKPPVPAVPAQSADNDVSPTINKNNARKGIPFGTLLPVRLIGSIYTLRTSDGFVRMELTRPVEGNGFSYPAGTTVIGNVRGGESVRAFVTIVGLIDPVSGELVRFSGELLGRDGSSGIEGRRRKLTSQWSRFFNGLKETASSVLGSVGAIRSGSTVVLSEPIRRGSESMSEDLSDALLRQGKDDSFIEVSAGANGYVLVTDLPKNSSDLNDDIKAEAGKK